MQTHSLSYTIQIFDTDCYGVAWHGSYAKWLEMGRCELLGQVGLSLKALTAEHDMVFPVTEQRVRYKASATVETPVTLTTQLRLEMPRLVFLQMVQDSESGRIYIEAETTVVMTNTAGKLQRRLPEWFLETIAPLLSP